MKRSLVEAAMKALRKILSRRICFAVCSLVYVPWLVLLSLNNFDMVHSQYRRAGERLRPAHIAAVALRELTDQCRQEARHGQRLPPVGEKGAAAADPCQSLPAAVVEARQKVVQARLAHERSLAGRKLVLFYVSFGVFFLLLPLVFLYLLLFFSSWVFRNIKVIK